MGWDDIEFRQLKNENTMQVKVIANVFVILDC